MKAGPISRPTIVSLKCRSRLIGCTSSAITPRSRNRNVSPTAKTPTAYQACAGRGQGCSTAAAAGRRASSADSVDTSSSRRDRPARHGMLEMERHDRGIGPERRPLRGDLVGAAGIVRVCSLEERSLMGLAVRPARLEVGLPGEAVVEHLDLPDAAVLDVLVLVDAGFPPLLRQRGGLVALARVAAALQQAAEAPAGGAPVRRHVHDVLKLQVIEQEPVDRPIASPRERGPEAADVEALHAA